MRDARVVLIEETREGRRKAPGIILDSNVFLGKIVTATK
jgi:hypothetical protein